MNSETVNLKERLAEIAVLIEKGESLDPQHYTHFFQYPELAFTLVDLIDNLKSGENEEISVFSACVFALDICVAQIHAGAEADNKISARELVRLMDYLADVINKQRHDLNFWLPVLNSFYEGQVDLTTKLQNAYFDLANSQDIPEFEDDFSHLDSIKHLIHELSDLSVYELAENFFAQSYAMPPDFFMDLLLDLYQIKEGHDVALLLLLHPKAAVREVVIATLSQIIQQVTLSPNSLSRLQTIMYWYPESYHELFSSWIKIQRKKGVTFIAEQPSAAKLIFHATEVDGTGSQGLFIHYQKRRTIRLCGLLLKNTSGVKDAWITASVTKQDVQEYYHQAFDENVTLRNVDAHYFTTMVNHFLAISIDQGEVPSVQFLEIQELLGLRLRPKKLDILQLLDDLAVQIIPFTEDSITKSLQRSKNWLKNKSFTESWYEENPVVDKIVNHNSSFINGTRVCNFENAINAVFTEEMELHRARWEFHFLWIALWFRSKERKNEKVWQDSFMIAYVIHHGKPLSEIPVMQEICYQTVINSIETMQERKTHLSQE